MSEVNPEAALEEMFAAPAAEAPEDEDDEPTTPEGEEVVAEVVEQEETPAEPETPDDDEGTLEDEGEQEESDDAEESGDSDSNAETPPSENPGLQALLDRYGGDKDKALLGYVESQKIISRQGDDNRRLAERVLQLESELEQTRMFQQDGPHFLTSEQQEWIEEAVQSGQAMGYVQQAIAVGEFDLARALVDTWGAEQPFPAMRAGTIIDRAEEQLRRQQQQAQPIDHSRLLETIAGAYPDLPTYEGKIVEVMATLGDMHPLVAAARSANPEEAVQGIVGLYEIARAQEATVRSTKDSVKRREREAGDRARQAAVVSSGGTAPATPQAPRQKEIMPGLTMEGLVAEMDK